MAELAPNDWAMDGWVVLTAAPLPVEPPPLSLLDPNPSCLLSSAYWSRSLFDCCSVTVANEPGVAVAWVL